MSSSNIVTNYFIFIFYILICLVIFTRLVCKSYKNFGNIKELRNIAIGCLHNFNRKLTINIEFNYIIIHKKQNEMIETNDKFFDNKLVTQELSKLIKLLLSSDDFTTFTLYEIRDHKKSIAASHAEDDNYIVIIYKYM